MKVSVELQNIWVNAESLKLNLLNNLFFHFVLLDCVLADLFDGDECPCFSVSNLIKGLPCLVDLSEFAITNALAEIKVAQLNLWIVGIS